MTDADKNKLGNELLMFLDSKAAEKIAFGYPETPRGTAGFIYPRLERRMESDRPKDIGKFVRGLAPYYLRNALNQENRYRIWQKKEEESK